MKTVGRVGLILGAALIVAGLTLVAVQLGWAQFLPLGRGEHAETDRPEFRQALREGQPLFGNERGPGASGEALERRPGRFGGGGEGLFALFKNLIIVGLIVGGVAALSLAVAALQQRFRRRPTATV